MAKVKVDMPEEPIVSSDNFDNEKIAEKVVKESFTDTGDIDVDNTIPIIVGVGVGLLTLLLIYLFSRRRSLGRDVLLCGISDSGKTTILSQLVAGKPVQTYTSMQHNKFPYSLDNGKAALALVDVPGSDRVRGQVVDKFSGSARAIVFVVDSNTVTKQVRDVAEYLHFLLTNKNIVNNSPPMLILCNKQDSGLAKGAGAVQGLLEKEIEKVRLTRSNQLAGTQTESRDHVFIGKQGKQFELSDLGCKVDFLESSALELDTLQSVKKWISAIA